MEKSRESRSVTTTLLQGLLGALVFLVACPTLGLVAVHESYHHHVAFSEKGDKALLLKARVRSEFYELNLKTGETTTVLSTWTPSGGVGFGNVQVDDIITPELRKAWNVPVMQDPMEAKIAVSDDERWEATEKTYQADFVIRDRRTGEEVFISKAGPNSKEWEPGGERVLVGYLERKIRVYHASGKKVWTGTGLPHHWGPEKDQFTVSEGEDLIPKVYNATTGQTVKTLPAEGVLDLEFQPGGSNLLFHRTRGQVSFLSEGSSQPRVLDGPGEWVWARSGKAFVIWRPTNHGYSLDYYTGDAEKLREIKGVE